MDAGFSELLFVVFCPVTMCANAQTLQPRAFTLIQIQPKGHCSETSNTERLPQCDAQEGRISVLRPTLIPAARVSGAQEYLKPGEGDQLIAEVTRLIAESKSASPVEIAA